MKHDKKLTRREFLDGAAKTTLAAAAIAAFGSETLAQKKTGKPFVFQTAHGDLEIRQNPFALALKNKSGKVLFETAPAAKRQGIGTANNFDRIARAIKIQRTANGISVEMETASRQKITFDITDALNAITLEARADNADALALAFGYASGEHISGMGQRLRTLDLRGIQINSVARVNDDGARTNNDDEFSAPLPFFLSNLGYAMFVETEGLWNFDFGKIDPDAISLQAVGKQLKLHLFAGATHKELIKKYTALTGRMARTADWNFGLWKWRDVYVDEFEVYQDAQMMRSLDLPTTAMIIDSPWSDKYIDFQLNPRQFPSGKTFLDNLHKMNLKTVFWIVPFINPNASNFKFADEKGYFVKDKNGKTLLVDWWNPTSSVELGQGAGRLGGMIDFTFPEATRWWQSEVGKIVDAGCDGWKLDDGEFLPLEARMHDGRTGAQVKSAYTAMYEKAVFEVMEKKKPNDYATMPRAAAAGAQKYMTAFWAGDQNADFDVQLGLPSVIMGAQSMGMCGFPVWTSDTGGYRQSPKPAVFARWTQFSAFCPLMIVGGKSYREPWHFSDEIETTFRRYAQLHHAMLPYIKTYTNEAYAQGTPIMRPMFLEFPNDAESYRHEYQFMFGADLLVAPVYTEKNSRDIYLPEGRWLDFDTLELYDGGKLLKDYPAPLARIPVFARLSNQIVSRFYAPLLAEQRAGLLDRIENHYLKIRGKYVRPQPFDRLKAATQKFKEATANPANYKTAVAELRQFIGHEENDGAIPYFTAKNLRERLADIELSVNAINKISEVLK